ncbi:MAG: cob(I)yrinic acid a,c-diamide adenosyltransferase [Bacteroidaceae bacterium]|jgi:cob(I)alamin adenosyltransferase|nr:cob(I)yrinic acid a,c-diamide adenosyltransferase [Bacteroidaceae bacterium]
MKIYTKTGDKGQTSLVGGVRVSKCCSRLEAYGTIDELNSNIGFLISYCNEQHDADFLQSVQKHLFVLGSYLATDTTVTPLRESSVVTDDMIVDVEKEIDGVEATLPPIKLFILPGGARSASFCHICRTICRRAERRVLTLAESGAEIDRNAICYLNRLSDYLFVLARKLNMLEGHNEIIWNRGK